MLLTKFVASYTEQGFDTSMTISSAISRPKQKTVPAKLLLVSLLYLVTSQGMFTHYGTGTKI